MKSLIKIIAGKIIDLLQDSRKDFRIIPFGIVLVYIFILFFSEFHLGSYAVIGSYFRIHPIPYFVDLKILLCGIDAIREGADPYTVICYQGSPFFNYPYIWGFLSFFPFITTSNLIYIGLGLALILFSVLYFYIGKINFFGAIVYTFLFVSPAIMLGVERGNCDLIIFILLLIPIFNKNNIVLFSFIVLITSFLKLFPIGSIFCILNNVNNRVKKSLWSFVSVILIFLMYLILMKENIIMVSQKTPRPYGGVSFGIGEIPSMFINYFKNYPSLKVFIFIIFIVLFLFTFIIFYHIVQKKIKTPLVDSGSKGISYLIGSGIFITTYLIGYNWEYRLIFLLFTIPQILCWIGENKFIAKNLLILSILIVWQSYTVSLLSIGIRGIYAYLFSQLFVILLFYGHLYILFNFLNSYYKMFSSKNVALKSVFSN